MNNDDHLQAKRRAVDAAPWSMNSPLMGPSLAGSTSTGVGARSVPDGVSSTIQPATSLVANDTDLIETEWVHAVKNTCQEYRQDPFMLNRAMTLLRTEYLKKRYKKTIKPTET